MTRFRWVYDQPSHQEIVSDGQTLWVYLPENNQVIQSAIEANAARADDPLTFLTGLGNLSRDFQIGWAAPEKDDSGNFRIQLRPRKTSPLIRTMEVVVNRQAVAELIEKGRSGKTFPILATAVTDANDNTTRIEFRSVRVNSGPGEEAFRFTIPEGVEVVRPTELPMGN